MTSAQPASEVMEPSQQMAQSTFQGPAASGVGVVGGTTGSTGPPQAPGYVGQQAAPPAQQQQTFNPNSRFVTSQNLSQSFILCWL